MQPLCLLSPPPAGAAGLSTRLLRPQSWAEEAAGQLHGAPDKSPTSVDVKAHADKLFQFPEADATKEAHEEAGRAMATVLRQGREIALDLVKESPSGGMNGLSREGLTREEARAEDERQTGALKARKLDCRGWQLVLTGHSLGAGVAALLALKMLRSFPKAKVWAFCPPGGLLTGTLAHYMAPFCTSVVLGKDGVPRTSMHNVARMMDHAVEAIARGRLSKTHVLWRNLRAKGRAKFQRPGAFNSLGHVAPECQAALDRCQDSRERTRGHLGPPTVPCGRVVYVRRLKGGDQPVRYDAVWIKAEDIMAEGLLISGRMLKDHMLGALIDGLDGAIDSCSAPPPSSSKASSEDHTPSPQGGPRTAFQVAGGTVKQAGRAVKQGGKNTANLAMVKGYSSGE